MGNSLMQSLTLKNFWKLISSVNLFEEDVFFRPSTHANLKDPRSRGTATTKMELFDQVTLYLGTLERKTIVLVAETRALFVLWPFSKRRSLHG